MTRACTTYFIVSVFLTLPAISFAGNDVYAYACSESRYLQCMNTNKSNCISAATSAVDTCNELYPHVSRRNEEELNAAATAYAKCTNEQYLSYLGADSDKLELCAIHIEAIFNKYRSDVVNQYNAE